MIASVSKTQRFLAVSLVLFGLGCAESQIGFPHPAELIRWPTSMLVDSDGRYAYVVNSNFDQLYKSGTIAVIDLVEERVLPDTTVQITPFGGIMRGLVDPDSGQVETLLIPSRQSDSIFRIDVQRDSEDSPPVLDCGGPADGDTGTCNEDHEYTSDEGLSPGEEPYASLILHELGPSHRIFISAGLVDGTLNFFWIQDDGALEKLAETTTNSGVQSMVYHPGTGTLVLAHKSKTFLTVIDLDFGLVDDTPVVNLGDPIFLQLPALVKTTVGLDFGRELSLLPDGHRIALVWRQPDSLYILEPDATQASRFRLVHEIAVGDGASRVVFAPFGVDGSWRAFVSSFKEDKIYVVDYEAGLVTNYVPVGRGPYELAVVHQEDRKWIVTADFEDGTLTIVDGDPESATHLQVITAVKGIEVEE